MGSIAMDFLRTSFAKLNADNYHLWKFKLELILLKEGLGESVTFAVPSNPDAEWKKRNKSSTVIISLFVEDNQLMLIKKATSAHDCWNIFMKKLRLGAVYVS